MTDMNDTEKAKKELTGDITCVLVKGENIYTSTKTGIAPMLNLIKDGVNLEGYSAADKIVGKAAAMLFVKAGVKDVFAEVISSDAISYLKKHKIEFSYNEATPYIINRKKTGNCPMEEAVKNTDDFNEGYEILVRKATPVKRCAIIGFGGLGKTHFINMNKITAERKDIELVAICDVNIEAVKDSVKLNFGEVNMADFDFSKYGLYTDYKEMIEREKLDFVLITLPTFLHAEVSIYCLSKGIHVFNEKPMALSLEDCKKMIEASENAGKKLMVGQCLRFSPAYKLLKDAIENNTYGKAIKAEFIRKSFLPGWTVGSWLLDEKKSGGCIVDMHIHDLDIMVWLFGKPDSFSSLSTHKFSPYESVYGLYNYGDFNVSIITDWGIHKTKEFMYSYCVTFEEAYVELLKDKVTIYQNEQKQEALLPNINIFYSEVMEFIDGLDEDKPFPHADINSVYESMKLIFEEKESCKKTL